APAAGRMEPALGRDPVRVLEHPHLVEVARVVAFDPVGRRAPLATIGELLDGPPSAMGAPEPEHQRVPVEPWSARTWSRANRSRANGAMSDGVRPVAMSSAMASPAAGMALKPHVPQPVVTRKPGTPVSPMIGEKSAEMSQIPAHVRRIRSSRRNG